jgi:hypothetical protein
MSTPKLNLFSDILAIVSAGAAALSQWQEQIDWGLRVLAALVAIVAGSIAIYQRLRAKRRLPLD